MHGIRLLGVLPVRPILSNPTLGMILEGVRGETIHPGPDLDRVIDGVAIGAMEPGHMLERVGPGTLVIVPGDREDVILTLTTAHFAPPVPARERRARRRGSRRSRPRRRTSGTAIVDGPRGRRDRARPDRRLPARDRRSSRDPRGRDLFATIVPEDTYVVASEVHDLLVKTHAGRPRQDRR